MAVIKILILWLSLNNLDSVIVTRGIRVGLDSFNVVYHFDSFHYMEPSVGRYICDSSGNNCREDTEAYRLSRHYDSKIFVYKISGHTTLVGSPFYGYYVETGCFEDVPEQFVEKAKYLQSVIDSNNILRIKNGANAIYKYIVTWKHYKTKYVSKEYGISIKELKEKKEFKTNKDAHRFIDEELLQPFGGGVDIKMDSVLIKKSQ